MSEQPPVSRALRIYRRVVTVGLVLYWLMMMTATHVPDVPKEFDTGVGDKTEHKVAYCLFGLGLGVVWSAWRGPLRWPVAIGLLGIAALYGAIDENTQPFFGRDCDLYDWFADLQGGSVGVAISLVYDWIVRKSRLFDPRRSPVDPK